MSLRKGEQNKVSGAPVSAPVATSPFESMDVEMRVRVLTRQAIEAMFPTRMFHVDAVVIAGDPGCEFIAAWPWVGGTRAAYVIVLPILPVAVAGRSVAEAFANTLQWLSHRTRRYGPPRLGSEADRWADELCALGIPEIPATEMNEWDERGGRSSWIDGEGPADDQPQNGMAL